jgi:hypothetical protein
VIVVIVPGPVLSAGQCIVVTVVTVVIVVACIVINIHFVQAKCLSFHSRIPIQIILGRFTGQFRCSDGHMARFSHWYPSILATSAVIGVATVGWVTFSITTMFGLANVT